MAKNIREIVKKLPKSQQQAIKTRAKTLIQKERLRQSKVMADLMLRAQEELDKLGVTVDQLKSGVRKRSQKRLKTRYPGVFKDKEY